MKIFVALFVIALLLVPFEPPKANAVKSTTPADSTEWLGWVTFNRPYSGIDPGFYGGNPPPIQCYRTDIEIGLRSDGTVVWRKLGKD